MKFDVFVDDNYHYQDESERYQRGSFASLAEAVACCKGIVDDCLAELYEPGMTAAALLGRYKMFGEDPFVRHEGQSSVPFSAWSYAEEKCGEICGRDLGRREGEG